MPQIVVQRIHFEDYGGQEFERLAFAHVLSVEEWDSIAWYGQLGSDRGRDIWGQLSNRGPHSTVCYQCANHRRLLFKKASEDIDKICSGPNKTPHKFVMILGGMVSADMRTRVADYATSKGISVSEVWSGPEFEERLRKRTPSLIQRFCEGVVFPESVSDLSLFILDGEKLEGDRLLAAYAACFDRPAFTTPFHQESSLPDFKKAITDTIEALQTGIHRLRDGSIIRRFPAISEVSDPDTKEGLRRIVVDLQKLRAAYDDLCRQGHVRPCDCGQADCPVHMMSSTACHEMDRLRREILGNLRRLYPEFAVRMW